MTQNLPNTSTSGVFTLTDNGCYQNDPLSVYQLLCQQTQHNLLLESAEVDKKHLLKSLLLTDAALKIVCNGSVVTFTALSINGEVALHYAASELDAHADILLAQDQKSFTATFADIAIELDEKARLSAVNPLQSLRLFTQLTNSDDHDFSVFFRRSFCV
jgi:anthranilate synthase component 1